MSNNKKYIHKVPLDYQGQSRLSIYVMGKFLFLETRSAVKKAIKRGQIKIDNRVGKTGDWVRAGHEITFEYSLNNFKKKDSQLDIYYEDSELIILRKAPGVRSSGNSSSLQSDLMALEIGESDGALPFPYLAHRLDRATEGLIIAAKKMQTLRLLAEMLEQHKIVKRYILIVDGEVDSALQWITDPIDGKTAKTEILDVQVLDTKDPTTRVVAQLHTGRTHQLRSHFQQLGHPIIGDQIYNRDGLNFGTGLLLCAYYLKFLHPITNDMIEVEFPIPNKINKYKPR